MKKVKLSLVTAALLATVGASAQSYSLTDGWNLVGSIEDNVSPSSFTQANSVWKYGKYVVDLEDKTGWTATSPNGDLSTSLDGVIDPLSKIDAGEGFWVNSNGVETVTTSGDTPSSSALSLKTGWQLLSGKSSSDISVGSTFNDATNITTVWKYGVKADGKVGWLAYSPSDTLTDTLKTAGIETLVTIKAGEGFWVNASGETDVLDSPPVVGGTISLDGLESDSSNAKVLYNTTGVGFTGSVQLYDVNDVNYDIPLLTTPIAIGADGSYNVVAGDFVDSTKANADGSYVVRAVIKKTGETAPIELSAVKLKGQSVEISPITTMVKNKILETINTFFGDKELDAEILVTVDLLAKQIVTAVEEDIKTGKMELKQANFVTAKTLEEEAGLNDDEQEALMLANKQNADRLKAQLESESSAAGTVSILTNKLSEGTDVVLGDIGKDFKITQTEVIAKFAYKTISTMARSGISVHSGDGRIIVFLPVPSEEFNTLPGAKYTIKTDDNKTIGDDAALRIIDLNTDLKNVSGFESWAWDLREVLDTPVMPYEALKTLMKATADKASVKFLEFGASFQDITLPTEMGGETMFNTNPLAIFEGKTIQNSEDVISLYGQEILKNNYDNIFWDQFWNGYDKAMNGDIAPTVALTDYMSVFGVLPGDTDAIVFERIKAKGFTKDENIDVAQFLNASIPYDVADTNGNLFQFGTITGVTVDANTTITPMAAFALTNLIMETKGDDKSNMTLKAKDVSEVFGFLKDSGVTVPEGAQVWFPDFAPSENASGKILYSTTGDASTGFYIPSSTEILGMQQFYRDLILGIVSSATGTSMTSTDVESTYNKVMLSISEVMPKFIEKMESSKMTEQSMGGFEGGGQFDENGQKETKITFKIKNNQGQDNLKISQVCFIPMLDDVKNYQWVESNTTVNFITKNAEGYYENNTTLNDWNKLVDIDTIQNEDGQYRQTDMFAVYASEGSEKYFVGHFPIFPIDENNLNELWFDSASFGDMTAPGMTNPMFNNGFEEYKVSLSDSTLFYPYLNTKTGEQIGENILTIQSNVLKATTNLVGTLNEGKIDLFVLAKNWDENSNVWMTNSFTPTSANQEAITIVEDIQEGGMILIKISSPSLQDHTLIGTIDYIDSEGNVKLLIEPAPMFGDMTMGGFDYWDTNSSITKLVASVKNMDGMPNLDVTDINYSSILSCNSVNMYSEYKIDTLNIDGGLKQLSGSMTKKAGGSFEKDGAVIINPSLQFSYNAGDPIASDTGGCYFHGNVAIKFNGSKNGETFSEDFGHFNMFKSDENNFGDFWWEKWDDSMDMNTFNPTPVDMENMFPETEMTTNVKFQVTKWDQTAMKDIVNTAVTKVIITRIVQDSSYNWIPLESDKVEIEVDTDNYFKPVVTLQPEGTTYSNGEKETGSFRFEVVTANGTFDIGWFPLFAQEENNLEYVYFDDTMYQDYDFLSYWDVESKLNSIGMGIATGIGNIDSAKSFIILDSLTQYAAINVDGNGAGTIQDWKMNDDKTDFIADGSAENFTYTKNSDGGYTIVDTEETFNINFMMSHSYNIEGVPFVFHNIQENNKNDMAVFEGEATSIKGLIDSMLIEQN